MKKTPLILVVGFLGAGKTTFLQALVSALDNVGLKASIFINDYQNARIDAERFRGLADSVTALNGDCVCCSSRTELLAALEKFQHEPGRVLLIETNGTTDSELLLETLAFAPALKKFTPPVQFSVIDGQRWQRRFWHNALERDQVRTANYLYISRTDTIPPERIQVVEESLAELGIHARRTEPADFASEIATLPDSDYSARSGFSNAQELSHQHEHSDHSHSRHHFASCEIPLPASVSKQDFENLLSSLSEDVLRMKGLVVLREDPGEYQVFQKVGHDGRVQYFPIGRNPTLRDPVALFIGPQLPVEELRKMISDLKN
jgi:G3E family GTPase